MLTSSALVLMMTIPGLALFYARHGAQEEHPGHPGPELRGDRPDHRALDGRSATRIAFTDGGANNSCIGGVKYLLLGPMGLNATSSLAADHP